ncbi:DUF3540 domain-containing protein [soil metagenome]
MKTDSVTALRREPDAPASPMVAMTTATVVAVGDSVVALVTPQGSITARVAASCLLRPQAGDHVACLATDDGSWIVAVLLRESGAEAVLQLDGDVRWHVRNGDFKLQVDHNLQAEAASIEARGREVSLVAENASMIGGTLRSSWTAVRQVGETLSSVFDQVLVNCRLRRSSIETVDSISAGQFDWHARQLAHIHAEHVVTTGERLVKTTGAQIHLG